MVKESSTEELYLKLVLKVDKDLDKKKNRRACRAGQMVWAMTEAEGLFQESKGSMKRN